MVEGGVYGLSEARRAHEDMQARRTSGKLLLDPGPVAPAIPPPRLRVAPAGRAPSSRLSRRGLPSAARRAARDPHTLAAPEAPIPADPLADEDLQLALYLCYELHYRGLPGVADELGVGAVAARAARGGSRRASRPGCSTRSARRRATSPPRTWTSRCARSPRPTTAPSLSRHLERDGHPRADARVRRAPLGLPAQGGRPALVGAAAADRRAEGGDGRDPGRRVRRRPGRAHPRGAVRQGDGRRSGSTRATAPTSTASRASRSRP